MRLVVQRVSQASVTIDGMVHSSIGKGLLVLVGIREADDRQDSEWLVQKLLNLRIFSDDAGKMNSSLADIQGELLIVSQFTLHASTTKGNRPSFIKAAKPEQAVPLYEGFVDLCRRSVPVKTGVFGADMQVALINDGPVTIIMDSKNRE